MNRATYSCRQLLLLLRTGHRPTDRGTERWAINSGGHCCQLISSFVFIPSFCSSYCSALLLERASERPGTGTETDGLRQKLRYGPHEDCLLASGTNTAKVKKKCLPVNTHRQPERPSDHRFGTGWLQTFRLGTAKRWKTFGAPKAPVYPASLPRKQPVRP